MDERFAWSSPERALDFAAALANVMIGVTPEPIGATDEERLSAVLRVMLDYSPVTEAVLWKLKSRAGFASKLAQSPSLPTVLSDASNIDWVRSISSVRPTENGENEEWSPISGKAKGISIGRAFGRICGPATPTDYVPNYLLMMQIEGESDDLVLPDGFLSGIQAKLVSGACALIDRRLTQITQEMTRYIAPDASAGAATAIDATLSRVLPRFVRCERMIRISQSDDGEYRLDRDIRLIGEPNDHPHSLTKEGLDELVAALAGTPSRPGPDGRARTTSLLFGADVRNQLKAADFDGFTGVMSVRIGSPSADDGDHGHIILVNRVSDLALRTSGALVPDHFDWEDEIYLGHIALVVSFIQELFAGEDARLRRAHILAHELHAPTEFIFGTAERLRDALDGKRDMPIQMMRRELTDILDTNDLQTALIDGLMLGLQTDSDPPALKYAPERIVVRDVAEKVSRMLMPVCRKHKVLHSGVSVRSFPSLYIDRRAVTQVFLNIATNAVKYVGRDKARFALDIFGEDCSITELRATNVPVEYLNLVDKMRIERGWIITFRDSGIGVPPRFRRKLFQPGARSNEPEVRAKQGAGLGLSVVRTIMRDHFGEVWLESAGRPTEFCLFFPSILLTGEYTNMPQWNGED